MTKTKNIVLSLFLCISANFAVAAEIPNRIPDELSIKEHWLSLTTSYDIETNTQKLGTLYRKFFSFMLTYDFYDPFDNKIAYARSKFFSFTAHFDVYDHNENYLGAADERLFAFFPTFDIYDRDGYTKLATASMNFWGTTFYIYDPVTNKEMAHMSRSFFRLKNDWTFKVSNRALLDQKGIDPRVLLTVIAFQGDREYWENQNKDKDNSLKGLRKANDVATDVTREQLQMLLNKIALINKQMDFVPLQQPNEHAVAAVANELEQGYQAMQSVDSSMQTSKERLNTFTDYCLNLVQANTLSDEKKKMVLFLLKTRLQEVVTR